MTNSTFPGAKPSISEPRLARRESWRTRGVPARELSAHLPPGMPVLVGVVYRALGVATPAAEFVLSSISLAFVFTAILALNAAFESLSVAPLARTGAIALLCLLPFHMSLEMGEFRYWEGSLAAAGIAVCLSRALKLDGDKQRTSWFDLSVLAFGAGVLSLFSEAGALACYGIIGWLALKTRGWLGFAGAAAISAILLVAILYPWALRNEAVFGEKVWTRTAFGINFAQGFYDKALNRADPWKAFNDRLDEVSPFTGPAALVEMRRVGGEAAYSRLLDRPHSGMDTQASAREPWARRKACLGILYAAALDVGAVCPVGPSSSRAWRGRPPSWGSPASSWASRGGTGATSMSRRVCFCPCCLTSSASQSCAINTRFSDCSSFLPPMRSSAPRASCRTDHHGNSPLSRRSARDRLRS